MRMRSLKNLVRRFALWINLAPFVIACAPAPTVQRIREDLGLGCDVVIASDPVVLARVSGLPAARIAQLRDVCLEAAIVDAALRAGAGAAGAP
jgi:hypothetical protein